MKKITYFALAILFICFSCSGEKKKTVTDIDIPVVPITSGFVTIIVAEHKLEDATEPNKFDLRKMNMIHFSDGYSSQSTVLEEKAKYHLVADTFRFYSHSPLASFCLVMEPDYNYNFLVYPNDTIHISFENNLPLVVSSNLGQKEKDYTWPNPQQFTFFDPQYKSLTPMNNKADIVDYYIHYYKGLDAVTDSLFHAQKISESVYKLGKIDIHSQLASLETKKIAKAKSSMNVSASDNVPSSNELSLLSYQFRQQINSNIRNKAGTFKPDAIFDNVYKNDSLDMRIKAYLLYDNLKKIQNLNEFKDRATKLLLLTDTDSVWSELIDAVTPLKIIDSKDMMLYNTEMKPIEFYKLMDSFKGKIVYIDVWASWCAPCKRTMPAAEKLRKEFSNENIVFLYLAYNDQEKAWLENVKKYKLNSKNAKSYLVASPKAEWIKEMKLKQIPRYMIYGKDGKLLDADAPGADDNELKNILEKLLRE